MISKLLSIILLGSLSLHAQLPEITNFKSQNIRSDYLVVCPDELLSSGIKLADYRNNSTTDMVENARVVSLSTIFKEFPIVDTCPRAYSIWYALKYAVENWAVTPQYVVLLGDDSVKVKEFDTLPSQSSVGLMPTFYYTAYKQSFENGGSTHSNTILDYSDFPYLTVADSVPPLNWFYNGYCIRSDPNRKYPFAFGRIPAQSNQECSIYIDKLIRYEANVSAGGSWYNRIALTTDDAMQGKEVDILSYIRPHVAASEALASPYLDAFFIDKTYLASFSEESPDNHTRGRANFINTINQGVRCAVYFGHGHPFALTDETYIGASDTVLFTNDSSPTIFFSFSCSNGQFHRRSRSQMCKSYLFTPRGGCIGYVAAPVETYAFSNERFAKSVFSQFDTTKSISLGNAVLNALAQTNSRNRYYQVLGDPAIQLAKERILSSTTGDFDTKGDYILSTTIQSDNTSPLNYRYQVSIKDSVTCLDEWTPKFVRDSIVDSYEGTTTDGTITTTISPSLFNYTAHYTLYFWNSTTEGRMDTIVSAMTVAVSNKQKIKRVSSFKLNRGILSISMPVAVQSQLVTVPIKLFALNGALIHTENIPVVNGTASLDLHKEGIPGGNYIFKISSENIKLSGKICIMQ